MNKSRKILYGFTLGVLILLIFCTVLSKFISDAIMPVVEVINPVSMAIESETYDKVIPSAAVITGAYNKKYVYIARQRKGLFGQEHYAVLVEVQVIAGNDLYAALGGWNVTVFDDVVISASKDLAMGDIVKVINNNSEQLK